MQKQVNHLTKFNFEEIGNHPMIENEMILQYMGSEIRQIGNLDTLVVFFSDGYFQSEFILTANIVENFQKQCKCLDIIKILFFIVFEKEEKRFTIREFSNIHDNIKQVVGKPIKYNPAIKNLENENGSNLITKPQTNFKPNTLTQGVSIKAPQNDTPMTTSGSLLIKRDKFEVKENVYNKISELSAPDKSWLIKARVINKQEIRPFRKNQGEYFSVILRDDSGKIRATFFKAMASYYINRLREGCVYSFTGGEVEKASAFNTTNNRFEIIFKENVIVTELEDEELIPKEEANFTTLLEAFKKPDNSIMDIIAIVKDPGELEFKELKRGGTKELKRITLVDQSNFQFEINVWGETAHKISLQKNEIYLFKSLKIKTFNDQRYLLWENFSKIFHDGFSNTQYYDLLEWRKRFLLEEESRVSRVIASN